MRVLVGVQRDSVFDVVLGVLRRWVRLGPTDRVILLHATGVVPWMREAAAANPELAARVRSEDEEAAAVMKEASRRLADWGVAVELRITDAFAVDEILRVAEETRADLIVVGARGRHRREFLVESVSQKIAVRARTDVLVVKRGAPPEGSWSRVLLVVDGTPGGLTGLTALVRKMRLTSADVQVVHADDVEPDRPPPRPSDPAAVPETVAALARHGISASRGMRVRAPIGGSDLVIVRSSRRSGLQRLFRASLVQEIVARGTASILVVRDRPETELGAEASSAPA
jgi:nucleotide-binding universal stress UspA family protein